MELELDIAGAQCPNCGAVHIVPGFSRLIAFVCDQCGRGVTPSGDSWKPRLPGTTIVFEAGYFIGLKGKPNVPIIRRIRIEDARGPGR